MHLSTKAALMSLALVPLLGLAQAITPPASDSMSRASMSPAPTDANKAIKRMQRQFNLIDTNYDGLISNAEYQFFIQKKFAQGDTNKDRNLSKEEFVQMNARGKNTSNEKIYP